MKRLKTIFVSLFCVLGIYAQNVVVLDEEDLKKKEINNIKRSEQAVYADVMELAGDDPGIITKAQQRSVQMLQTHVIEIFAKRMKMDKKDVQEIWDVIDDKCQNVIVKKGDIFRVFTYIMKDAVGLGPKKPKKGDIEEYLGDDTQNVAAEEKKNTEEMANQMIQMMGGNQDIAAVATEDAKLVQQEQVETPVLETAPAQPVQATPVVEAAPVQTTPVVETTPVQQTASAQQVAPAQQTPVVTQQVAPTTLIMHPTPAQQAAPVQVVQPEPQPEPEPAPAVVEIPSLVQTMLSQENMTELLRFLVKEKNRQTLMYGGLSTMTNIEDCYVVIIDKGAKKVVTVLGLGKIDRMNYVTFKQDAISNYRGGNYQAVLVQEYK